MPFDWMFLCFGVFIISCGLTHLMEVWTLWHPDYWLSGAVKLVTAVASLCTAGLLVRLVPKALALPSPSDLRNAAAALRASEHRFRAAAEGSQDAFYILDAVRDEAGRIHDFRCVYANSHARARAARGSSGDVAGLAVAEVFPANAAQIVLERCRRVMHERATLDEELCVALPEQAPMWLHAQIVPLDAGVAVTARDITQRLVTDNALKLANRELEAFSYSVAHDLRAPLRGISSFAKILAAEHTAALDADARECVQEILGNAGAMGRLIDALLALSRVTRSELRLETVDVTALVRSVADELARAEPERRVQLEVEPGLSATMDLVLAQTLFTNLLGNAWKFTARTPHARVAVGATTHLGLPAFYVRDNGAGFDESFANKLFAPFQRLHSAEEFEGTGIGLATVQRIVHRHGGEVWAHGSVGGGASFCFSVPVHALDNRS